MIFGISYDNQPKSFLKKLDKHLAKRIVDKIDETLPNNPVPQDAKRALGYGLPTFRIRVGKYRVLYRINYEIKVIVIVKIDKRERVY